MKVKFFVFDVLMKGDIVEKEYEVRNGADYFKKKKRFAKEIGDCDHCKYAYYETDHGYAYEESKLHCKLKEEYKI